MLDRTRIAKVVSYSTSLGGYVGVADSQCVQLPWKQLAYRTAGVGVQSQHSTNEIHTWPPSPQPFLGPSATLLVPRAQSAPRLDYPVPPSSRQRPRPATPQKPSPCLDLPSTGRCSITDSIVVRRNLSITCDLSIVFFTVARQSAYSTAGQTGGTRRTWNSLLRDSSLQY